MANLLGVRGSYSVQAGRLRFRVTLESRYQSRDSAGGVIDQWVTFESNIPAALEALSGREFFSARQIESTIDTVISIRWRPGVTQTMRVLHKDDIYDINAVLPDAETGKKTLTLMCTKRSADGFRQ